MKKAPLLDRTIGHLMRKGMKVTEARTVAIRTLRAAGDMQKGSLELTQQGKYRERVPSSERPTNKPGAFSRPMKY
jgi:hypothetical protein